MKQAIEAETLQDHLNGLESYQHWRQARDEQKAVAELVPPQDVEDPDYLTKQLGLVEAKKITTTAWQSLLVEIGEQDDSFAPLHYRLGALSAFVSVMNRLPRQLWKIDTAVENRIFPNSNPVNRAVQIGDELNAITQVLDSNHPVPVALVQSHFCLSCRRDDTRVISGEIVEPEQALDVQAPEVIETEDRKYVEFEIPLVLRGIGNIVRYHGHHAWYSPQIRDYSTTTVEHGIITAPIPRLELLTTKRAGGANIDALYIGQRALDRVASLHAIDGPNAVSFPSKNRGSGGKSYRRIGRTL